MVRLAEAATVRGQDILGERKSRKGFVLRRSVAVRFPMLERRLRYTRANHGEPRKADG